MSVRTALVGLGLFASVACGASQSTHERETGSSSTRDDGSLLPRIALGTETACAIGADGQLRCWGRYAPELSRLGEARAVAIGDGVGCAITAGGALWCWGRDLLTAEITCFAGAGVIYPDPMPASTPPAVAAECPPREIDLGGRVDAVWVGSTIGCARRESGEVMCWGRGAIERIAPPEGPASVPRRAPVLERALDDAHVLALADDHGCLVDRDHHVRCFGDDTNGQLGDGGADFRTEPVVVEGLSNVRIVRVVEQRSCALDGDGVVWCWGSRGLDNPEIDRRPVRIEAPEPLTTLAISRLSGCGVSASGRAHCWGAPFRGRLGIETDGAVRALVAIPRFDGVDEIATGVMYTCARRSDTLVCTGEVPSAAAADLGPLFVEPTPATLPERPAPSGVRTSCTADADCLLGGPACCEPCDGWPVSELAAFHRNDTDAFRLRVCPEPMACPGCAAPEPPADARCVEGMCRVVARSRAD